MKFQIGDRVKITEAESGNYGKIGKITSAAVEHDWHVTFANKETELFHNRYLEFVSRTTRNIMEFKVGDLVRIRRSDEYGGYTGTIQGIDTDLLYPFTVHLPSMGTRRFKKKNLLSINNKEKKMNPDYVVKTEEGEEKPKKQAVITTKRDGEGEVNFFLNGELFMYLEKSGRLDRMATREDDILRQEFEATGIRFNKDGQVLTEGEEEA